MHIHWNHASIRLLFTTLALSGSSAFAQAPSGAPNPIEGLMVNLPIVLVLFLLFYFGLIRPQKAQQKKHAEFLANLNRGDEVVTSSGMIGTIRGLTDRVVTIEIAPGTEVKFLRPQVQSLLKEVLQPANTNTSTVTTPASK